MAKGQIKKQVVRPMGFKKFKCHSQFPSQTYCMHTKHSLLPAAVPSVRILKIKDQWKYKKIYKAMFLLKSICPFLPFRPVPSAPSLSELPVAEQLCHCTHSSYKS